MPSESEWQTVPLGTLCDEERGITYGIVKVGDFIPGGVPILRGGDIRNGRLVFDDHKRVSEEVSNQFKRTILRGGEIVINLISEPGHSAIVPSTFSGFNVSRDVAVIPLVNSVNHEFINFYLRSRACIEWLTGRLQGSVTQKINLSTLREVPIPLPTLEEQGGIADTLGSIEGKISLLQETNATLEAIAQALFKSWFVDFDPVRAKVDGRDPEGVPPEVAELFPNEFEDSELGAIPKGWRIGRIEDLSERVGMGPFGSNIKVSTFVEKGIPVISGQHLRGTLLEDSTYNYITEDHAQKLSSSLVGEGDVVFTHAGNIGQVALIPKGARYNRYVLSQRQFFIRCKPDLISPIWVTYYFKSSGGQHVLLANASQVGVPSIARPVSYVKSIKLVVPLPQIANAFDEIVQSLIGRIASARNEVVTLMEIRDTLLPRLMSGKLETLTESAGTR